MKKQLTYKKYNVIQVIGILVLVTVVLGSVWGIKANAAQKAENDKTEYQLQEIELKHKIRNCLEEQGYYNSGITITKVMEADGSREYTVLLHHSDLDASDNEKVEEIYEVLSYIQVQCINMTVNYTIF